MRGNRATSCWDRKSWPGLSPRVRGNQHVGPGSLGPGGSIPACAGNGVSARFSHAEATVHPRACGERGSQLSEGAIAIGSSPRVRGTEHVFPLASGKARFIPARAGNGQSCRVPNPSATVHPRACGERPAPPRRRQSSYGSSPRVRGTAIQAAEMPLTGRFIPARAGNGSISRTR